MAPYCVGISWKKHRLDGCTHVLLRLLYCHMFVAFGRLDMNLLWTVFPTIPVFIGLTEPGNNIPLNT